jgi:uncharacterized membrane protein HdeD (DUF308 family)
MSSLAHSPRILFLGQRWWALLLRGVAAILFAVIAFVQPVAAIAALMLLFAAFILVDGVFGLAASIARARAGERWGWLALEAALSIVLGVLILAWPALSVALFLAIVAVRAAFSGVLLLLSAAALDGAHGRGWMILAGVANLLFAIALVAAPFAGLLVITWWFAIWALVVGILLVILGFRVRAARQNMA